MSAQPSQDSTAGSGGSTAPPEVEKRVLHRAIAASAMGNATEWFDYGVYAVMTTYITANFFPGQTVWTLATFAISFLVRPLGGFFWGPLGDKLGRKNVLAMTILLMAAGTFLIGVLPTYQQIGLWAPAMLIFLRMIQGFAAGGEYGGAATFMAEYSPDKKRGFYGSFLEFGTLAGFSLGSLIALLLELFISPGSMQSWGWRLPFLLAGPMGVIGWYLRSKLEDSPCFRELEEKGAAEGGAGTAITDLISRYWRPMLMMSGLVIALNVVNYTLLSFMPTYLEATLGLTQKNTLTIVLIGQLIMMGLIPFFGKLSDRVGRKPMWWTSLIGLTVLAVPMYMLMAQSIGLAIVGFVVLGIFYLPQLATISATFPALFPTQVRYAGFAITYNIATAAFGGTAPLANEALINSTGSNLVPAFYMMVACIIGMIALKFMPETTGASLRGTGVPGVDSEAHLAKK